jgi:hypothetical protein
MTFDPCHPKLRRSFHHPDHGVKSNHTGNEQRNIAGYYTEYDSHMVTEDSRTGLHCTDIPRYLAHAVTSMNKGWDGVGEEAQMLK